MLKKLDPTCLELKISSSLVPFKDLQGDWPAYLQQCARYHGNEENRGNVIAYQRQCALAYLGKRAQIHGSVCSKHPRIFTPKLLFDLELLNKTKRFSRYPWLETLLSLLLKIEHMQNQADAGNVISLVSHRTS